MPDPTPPPAGCDRLLIVRAQLESITGAVILAPELSYTCHLLHCAAYSLELGSCNPNAVLKCPHCPGASHALDPKRETEQPT